ncbi:MAG: YegP family protein [Steroidobacteraceae bacterium]
MAGYFELKKAANDKYRFNLKSGNHQVVLTGQAYSSRAAALAGIESVRSNCADDSNFERKTAKDGSPFFTLKSGRNGQVLGVSETYSSKSAAETGIASVKANAPGAAIKEP